MFCLVCSTEIHNKYFSRHLKKVHEESPESYTFRYLLNNQPVLCACGCVQETKYVSKEYRFNEYIHNHHKPSLGKIFSEETKKKISLKAKARQQKFSKKQKLKNTKIMRAAGKKASLEKFGVENPFYSGEVQKQIHENLNYDAILNKSKKTNLERYGAEFPLQSPEIQKKVQKTHLNIYGTKSPMQNEKVKLKTKESNVEKYGNPSSLHGINQQRTEQVFIEKYGVSNPSQIDGMQERIKKIYLEKYGVDNPAKLKFIQDKIKLTNFRKFGASAYTDTEEYKNYMAEITRLIWQEIVDRCEKKGYIPLFSYEDYQYDRQVLKFKCKEHDKEFYSCLFNISNVHHNCPSCKHGGVSMQEKEVLEFVKSVYFGEVQENIRSIIAPKEIDIWVPERKLAIEYSGLYWHSSANPAWQRHGHRDKAKAVHDLGHKFFMIFEDEWKNKRHLVEQMIKYRLGMVKNKIYARKCEVIKYDKCAQLKPFFTQNHLDGYTNASFGYALVCNNIIMAAITVRTNHQGEKEIARFATNCDYVVVGAGSKLLGLLPRPIVTFSNNRLSNGELYRNNGGKNITRTFSPSYYYTDLNERIWRYKCKRYNFPHDISEEEFNKYPTEWTQATNGIFSRKIFGDERPLYRIEDSGHTKWLLE